GTADSPIWKPPVPDQVALALWLVSVRLPRRFLVPLPVMLSVAVLAMVVLPGPYSSPPVQVKAAVTVSAPVPARAPPSWVKLATDTAVFTFKVPLPRAYSPGAFSCDPASRV